MHPKRPLISVAPLLAVAVMSLAPVLRVPWPGPDPDAGTVPTRPGGRGDAATERAAAVAALGGDLDRLIAGRHEGDDRWSVLVVSLDDGDTLYARAADEALIPASNMKLFTTAAAFRHLGPDFRFVTYLVARGRVHEGVVHGDLVVYGTGDPSLSGRFHDRRTAVWDALADSLRALGIREVRGDLVGDASYFGDHGHGAGWKDHYTTRSYAAPASALSFNGNVVTLRIAPGAVGGPPTITLTPGGDGVTVLNRARTVSRGRAWIDVDRLSYEEPIVVRGQVRRGQTGYWRTVPVDDPARYAAAVLGDVLAEHGIAVHGQVRSIGPGRTSPVSSRRDFAPALDGTAPLQVLAVHRSPPLQRILEVVNRRSHNFYAEMVLRTVGRVALADGTARGGARAVAAVLGPAAPGLAMYDGSGLSVLNRASAGDIVTLLRRLADSDHAAAFRATLPEAGSGDLRRMLHTPAAGNLRAKTGTIRRVSALSGYVAAANGERLAFSILSNGVPSRWRAKRIEDEIGARLAAFNRPTVLGEWASPADGEETSTSD